jgi:hypothetical protein
LTYVRIKNGNGQSKLETIFLYEDIEMTKPKWLVHPVYKEKVDVIAIELNINEEFIYLPMVNFPVFQTI